MDWFCVLSVDLEPPCREQVECALKNTAASFVTYEEEKAIGMVRLIGDGGMSFYIKDFAVLPEYQGKGLRKDHVSGMSHKVRGTLVCEDRSGA